MKKKFEVGKAYFPFISREMFVCIGRTKKTVTFQRETLAKHTLKTGFSRDGVEYACLGFIFLSAQTGE